MSFRCRFADGDHVSRNVDGLARANELADPYCWSRNAGDVGVLGRCLGCAIATRKAEQTLIQLKDRDVLEAHESSQCRRSNGRDFS